MIFTLYNYIAFIIKCANKITIRSRTINPELHMREYPRCSAMIVISRQSHAFEYIYIYIQLKNIVLVKVNTAHIFT